MLIATANEMRNIDQRAIKDYGIPGPVLMENAAAGIMAEMERFFAGLAGLRVAIVCGKGNNGGDGLALARRLRIKGIAVRVGLLASFRSVKGEAGVNLVILRKTDVEIVENATARSLNELITWSDVVVDALLGVGLSSPLTGIYAKTVDLLNSSAKPIVSVDIPTGIDADLGRVMGTAVKADLTVTMAMLKRGLVQGEGAFHAGLVRIVDLGIPPEAIEKEKIAVSLIDADFCRGAIAPRQRDSHKGTFGHVLVIAGSPGKAGAAVMTAEGALRTGPGLVTVATPNSIVPIIQSHLQEAMCRPSLESMEGTLGIGSEEDLLAASEEMDACVIGPGLSTHFETAQVVRNLVTQLQVPMVIDADGLNSLVGQTALLTKAKAPVVITPHPGELARLTGLTAAEVQQDRIGLAERFSRLHRVVVVLKGAGTVVASPDGRVFVNASGNPGMATGGTGDVLTGMIAGLLAQGHPGVEAVCLAVYLHGRAGDLAAAEKGEAGMITGDLIDRIPAALKELVGQ